MESDTDAPMEAVAGAGDPCALVVQQAVRKPRKNLCVVCGPTSLKRRRIPKNPVTRDAWIEALGLQGVPIKEYARICEAHFVDGEAIPRLQLADEDMDVEMNQSVAEENRYVVVELIRELVGDVVDVAVVDDVAVADNIAVAVAEDADDVAINVDVADDVAVDFDDVEVDLSRVHLYHGEGSYVYTAAEQAIQLKAQIETYRSLTHSQKVTDVVYQEATNVKEKDALIRTLMDENFALKRDASTASRKLADKEDENSRLRHQLGNLMHSENLIQAKNEELKTMRKKVHSLQTMLGESRRSMKVAKK